MGSVKIDVYNSHLMNMDYSNTGCLKHLLSNINTLLKIAEKGDSAALSIYIDLKTALECETLTELQAYCLKLHFIDKESVLNISRMLERDESTIRGHIAGGLVRLQRTLLGGGLYGTKRDRKNGR